MSDPRATANPAKWYVMRDLKRANAKQPAYRYLEGKGFEVFTPLVWKLSVSQGKRTRVQVPFIPDLLFIHGDKEELDTVVDCIGTLQYRYLRGGYRLPMTVPDVEMERFIRAVRSSETPRYFLPGEVSPRMYGRRIRIVGGSLDGYEGSLLTTRGSKVKRLLVELKGFLSVGVEVNPEYIELL